MNYHRPITQALVDQILELVHKYDDTMMLPTALGCLDIAKMQLIQEAMDEDEE